MVGGSRRGQAEKTASPGGENVSKPESKKAENKAALCGRPAAHSSLFVSQFLTPPPPPPPPPPASLAKTRERALLFHSL